MTGIVLVLAGLTCADGAQGTGAATAAVWATPRPDVRWEYEVWRDGVGRVRVRLEGERFSFKTGRSGVAGPVVFLPDGSFVFGWWRYPYSFNGDRLTIRGPNMAPLTLHPAAPRKP